jgi:hypothetical protein
VHVQACFSCGRSYSYNTGDGRFCDPRCRQWFDAGDARYDHRYSDKSNPRWYSLPMGRHGFLIPCAGCGKTFDSKGLRCCSTACERRYRQQEEAAAIIAEVAMERLTKRACLHCGGDIPNWLNPGTPKAKRVPSSRKFCSPTCQSRHSRAQKGVSDSVGA